MWHHPNPDRKASVIHDSQLCHNDLVGIGAEASPGLALELDRRKGDQHRHWEEKGVGQASGGGEGSGIGVVEGDTEQPDLPLEMHGCAVEGDGRRFGGHLASEVVMLSILASAWAREAQRHGSNEHDISVGFKGARGNRSSSQNGGRCAVTWWSPTVANLGGFGWSRMEMSDMPSAKGHGRARRGHERLLFPLLFVSRSRHRCFPLLLSFAMDGTWVWDLKFLHFCHWEHGQEALKPSIFYIIPPPFLSFSPFSLSWL